MNAMASPRGVGSLNTLGWVARRRNPAATIGRISEGQACCALVCLGSGPVTVIARIVAGILEIA